MTNVGACRTCGFLRSKDHKNPDPRAPLEVCKEKTAKKLCFFTVFPLDWAKPGKLLGKGAVRKGAFLAFFLGFLFLWCVFPCAAQTFPLIRRLDMGDTGFKQYIADVEASRRRLFNREHSGEDAQSFAETLTIYQYTPRENEDLFALAARCNVPYSSIASLNRLSHPVMLETGKPLLLPSTPGLFIPEVPGTDLERLLAAGHLENQQNDAVELRIPINAGGAPLAAQTFYFFPGADFNPTERVFFLNAGFRFPLRNYRLTSSFGTRQNPITGNTRFHQGLDLAAPAGTEVFAAAEGIVTEVGEDSIYGKYIIIKHGESWASLYGHLQKVETALRSIVRSGTLIGRVGSTGQSTGPHLHFELRQNGKARDPGKFLFQD